MKDKRSSDPQGRKRPAARRRPKSDDASVPPADAGKQPAPKRRRAAAKRKPAARKKVASGGGLKAQVEALEQELAQARKALQESRDQCRFLFHDSLLINVVIGLDGKVLDLNDRASESIGYSREELIGAGTAEMFAPECREFAEALLTSALKGEPTEQAELTLIGKAGPRTYIFTAGQVPVHEDGKLIGMLVSGVDITERQNAQKARNELQEQYRALIENLPVGLGRSTPGPDGRFIMVNPAMARMFGYASVAELVQKPVSELYQGSPQWEEFRQKLRADLRVVGMEMHLHRQDGVPWWASVTVNGVCGPDGRVEYFDGMVEDITERKRTEEALRESERRFRSVLEASGDLIYRFNLAGTLDYVSPSAAAVSGYSPEEIIARGPAGFLQAVHPDDRQEVMLDLNNLPPEDNRLRHKPEFRWRCKDGIYRWFCDSRVFVRDEHGQPTAVVGAIRDITESKLVEEALRLSERRLQLILQCSTDGINIAELDTRTGKRRLILCNDRYLEMTGRSREEMFAVEDLNTLLRPSPPEQVKEDLGRMMRGEPFAGVTSWYRPDGRENHFEWRASAMRTDEHHFSVIGVDRDVTQRLQTEEALRRWEEETRRLLDGLDGFLWTAEARKPWDWDMQISATKGFERVTGYTTQEAFDLTGHCINGIAFPEDIPMKDVAGRRALAGEIDGYYQEYRIRHKSGQVRWLGESVRVASRTDNGMRIIGACMDITQRKEAEEALRKWEDDTREVLDGLDGFLWTSQAREPWDWNMKIPSAKGFERVTGYTREEAFYATGNSFNNITLPEDIPVKDVAGRRALAGEIDGYYQEYRIRHKSGQIRWLGESVRVASRTEDGVRFIGACLDITHRKQAEEALRKWEDDTRELLDGLEGFLWTAKAREPWDWDMKIPSVKGFERVTGYTPDEIIKATGRIINGITVPEDILIKDSPGKQALAGKIDGYYHEYRIRHKSGQIRWLGESVRVASRTEDGLRFIGACLDITHRKQAEEALRKWEEETRRLLDGLDGFLWTAEARPGIIDWEMQIPSVKGFERVTGYTPEETLQTTTRFINSITISEDICDKDEAGKRAVAGEIDGYYQEYRIRHKNGQIRWLGESVRVASRTEDGVRFIGACLDITHRKQAEEALRASEERFRTIFDAASDAFFVLDFDGRILEASAHATKMYGHSHEEFIDLSIRRLTHFSHHRLVDQLLKGAHARHEFHAEAINIRKDSRLINVDLRATVVEFRGNRHILLTLHDITERKQAEKMMQALHRQLITAREKERSRLARELHDSIGQSLVAMRLSMQTTISGARHTMDESTLSTLTNAAEKCNSLIGEVRTICHGLYPPALESLGLLAALRGLARECQSQVQVSVECQGTMEATRFPSEVEIELFRIAQEAANNALRHSQAGQIRLGLTYEDGQAILTIADDGAGFDPDKTLEAGMGLNTMRDRAQTVGGQLTIASGPDGTRVSVRVPTECRRLDAVEDKGRE